MWKTMRRRDFIALLAGAAAASPLRARAEEPDRMRRVGVLNALAEGAPTAQAWEGAFRQRLTELGWSDGRNVCVDYRRGATNVDLLQSFAKELVSLKPDALVGITTPATAALQAQTRSIPIVFAAVSDPIGSGFVKSLASPGGNTTGLIDIEASLSGKWLDLMRAIAPRVSRVALLFNPQTAPYLDTFRAAAPAFAIEPIEAPA
jgi:putative ABC transport system substrate-binding protein